MKILMLGWEYPPHIMGGLGTACYGLTRALKKTGSTSVQFVVPKLHGDEDHTPARLYAAQDFEAYDCCCDDGAAAANSEPETLRIERYLDSRYAGQELRIRASAAARRECVCSRDSGRVALIGGAYEYRSIEGATAYASRVDALVRHIAHIDLIHAHDWLTFLAAARAKQITRRPLVVHVHSTEIDRTGERYNRSIFRIEQFGMQVADKVIAVSEYTRRHLIERYAIAPEKIVTVHNGAERPERPERLPIRAPELSSAPVVSFIGRITAQKGPRYFVEAAQHILREIVGTRFVMAGNGDLLPVMKALVAAKGLDAHFDFPGFLTAEEVRQQLAASSIYVMPSLSEPFGIGALEAVLANVPVVLSSHCGVAEVIVHLSKVPPGDSAALAQAIIELLSDPMRARKQSQIAFREAHDVNWERSAAGVLAVYRTLVKDEAYAIPGPATVQPSFHSG